MNKKLKYVLLIDDDDTVNFINQVVIKKADITDNIITALNGKEALDFLENYNYQNQGDPSISEYSLILLDINMPVMDGWEFLDAYRNAKIPDKKNTHLVMLSTSLNPDDRARAEKIDVVSSFYSKPLSSVFRDRRQNCCEQLNIEFYKAQKSERLANAHFDQGNIGRILSNFLQLFFQVE